MSRIAIACALCLLLAGCAAPTAQQTTVASETSGATGTTDADSAATDSTGSENESAVSDRDIPVSGGSLPVAHEEIFARTTDLLGTDVAPPTVLIVKSAAEIRNDTGGPPNAGSGSSARSFAGVMGIGGDGGSGGSDDDSDDETTDDGSGDESDGGSDRGVSVAAYAPSARSVIVNERVATAADERALERTLAHEFVHTVQFRQRAFARLQRALDVDGTPTRDTYLTYASVVEGAAAFVGDAYDRRYLAGDWASITTTERYRSAPPRVKYSIARYYFGSRYLSHRFDSPRNLSAVYDAPPRTTEQILHNDTDRSETPRSLALSVEPGENRTRGRSDTYGELFTRIAVGTELNRTRAADAAAGWGTDRLVRVTDEDGTRSYVWATRWDSPSEADEFEMALTTYLDARANESANRSAADSPTTWRDGELTFRTVRTSEESVVLLAGTESFVRSASVSGTNESVSVAAGEGAHD
ncbi:hypothetical protein M0R88_15085 [Halorussus gelatinilyticus]|uniref:DUF4157 domain-containing protein n=1 Tax=Halorussus gelatinilyticus TaxID=2937524 RepID=A0A8U0IGM7_9EURY|nr:hypothetical protein [Halorussus gelatinilyticus]UPV99830.1 hypothetical protein M0R88_15085 [Halorussus gelatinilyticus]